jgi:hypothetical protein
MAWVNPSTRATGALITAAIWDQDVRANTEFLARPPSVSLQKSTEQSIANASWRSVSWNTENWDTDTMWSSTAPTRIDINTSGKWELSATVSWDTGSGLRIVGFTVGGSTTATPSPLLDRRQITSEYAIATVTDTRSLTSTQFVRLQVYQANGSALNLSHDGTEFITHMAARWVSS